MPDPFIPGIRRQKMKSPSGDFEEFYFLINLDELTTEAAFLEPGHKSNSGTRKKFWSLNDLATCFLGKEQLITVFEEDAEVVIDRFIEEINDLKMNRKALEQAFGTEGGEKGFSSELSSGPPTILFLRERITRNKRLQATYRMLAAERTYEVELGSSAEIILQLLEFDKLMVQPVERINERLRKEMAPVTRALGMVQNAHMAVVAMIDCAGKPEQRMALWGTHPPRAHGQVVTQRRLIPSSPKESQLSDAAYIRDDVLPLLAGEIADLRKWMSSGKPTKVMPKVYHTSLARNYGASNLLTGLRDSELILLLLRKREFVAPAVWWTLEQMLLRAFTQMQTAPDTAYELSGSEFMTLARISVEPDLEVSLSTSNPRERELRARLGSFVARAELGEKKTALSKALETLKSAKDKTDKFVAYGDTLGRLMSCVMPTMISRVGADAKKSGQDPELTITAWLFQTVIGLSQSSDAAADALLRDVTKFATTLEGAPDRVVARNAEKMFDLRGGALAKGDRFHVASDVAQGALKGVVASLALAQAMRENAATNGRSASQQLNLIKAVLEASGTAIALVGAIAKSPHVLRAAGSRGAGLLGKISGFADHGFLRGVGHFASFLGFVSSVVVASNATGLDATASEKQMEAIVVSALDLMVAVTAEFIVGGLPVATLVLFVAQAVFFDRDLWALGLGVENRPAPGRYVRGVWQEMHKKEFTRIWRHLAYKNRLDLRIGILRDMTPEATDRGRQPFWDLWPRGFVGNNTIRKIMMEQYGFDDASARMIAGIS